MRTRYWLLLGLSLGLMPLLHGCENRAASGGVAVIDLDVVAAELGFADNINQAIAATEQQVQQQLEQLQNDLYEQVTQRAQTLGENPTEAQREAFEQFRVQVDQEFRGAITQAQQHIDRVRMTLIGEFRQQVRPIARQEADNRGLGVVLVLHDGILDHPPGADITAPVVRALRDGGLTLPQMPPMSNTPPAPQAPSPLDPAMPTQPLLPEQAPILPPTEQPF